MSSTLAKDWLSRKEAAQHLSAMGFVINHRSLERMASENYGPPYRKCGPRGARFARAIYNRQSLEAWAREYFTDVHPPANKPKAA